MLNLQVMQNKEKCNNPKRLISLTVLTYVLYWEMSLTNSNLCSLASGKCIVSVLFSRDNKDANDLLQFDPLTLIPPMGNRCGASLVFNLVASSNHTLCVAICSRATLVNEIRSAGCR